MNRDANQVAYLRWLSEAHPDLYRRAIAGANAYRDVGLGQLGWLNFVIQAIGIAAEGLQQKKAIDNQSKLANKQLAADAAALNADRENQLKIALLNTNTERAKAGLAPVDINGVVIPGSALPTPAGLKPLVNATGAVREDFIPGVPNYVLYGTGIALLLGLVVLRR